MDKLLGIKPETGYGRCLRCGWSWLHGGYHTTYYENAGVDDSGVRQGLFVLCEECWQRLEPAARLPYYRMIWEDWHRFPNDTWTHEKMVAEADELDRIWPLIEAAVLGEVA